MDRGPIASPPGLPAKLRAQYRHALRQPAARICRGGDTFRVHWSGSTDPSEPEILEGVLAGIHAPAHVYKRSAVSHVMRLDLAGRSVLVKYYVCPEGWRGLTYSFRASRARRAWAAARILGSAGIPAPAPYGFIDVVRGGRPAGSYALHECVEGARPARRWIKAWLHQRPDAFRTAIRAEGVALLTDLYRREIYHADTKTSNILVRDPDDPSRRRFYWIDLEAVRFGVRPSRRLILRNLIQLNGSVGSKLAVEDRLAFLEDLADYAPWVTEPWVADRIKTVTLKRLNRERRGECGP